MADIIQPEPEVQPDASQSVENSTEEPQINTPAKELILSDKQRAVLLQKLGKQLIYYFSSQNLATDTYLTTIMNLNTGYVPLTIVSNFAKIMRIVSSHTNYVQLGEDDICGLIREAALQQSNLLNMVLLNQEGKVISKYGDENYDPKAQNLTLEALGPNGGSIGEQHVRTSRSDSIARESSRVTPEPESRNIVILRDVPEDATEDDILDIFKNAEDSSTPSPIISSLAREHGNCWFVSLESNKHEMVSILLDLRNKKICNEPVKARLKSVSVASQSSSVPMQAPNYYAYRKLQGPARIFNNNQIYSGDRPHYSKKGNGRGQLNGYKHGARGGRGSGGVYSSTGSSQKGNGSNGKKGIEEKAVPPPPLVEEHFPTLGDSPKTSNDVKESNSEAPTEKNDNRTAGMGLSHVFNTSGYAAALKKAVPPEAVQFNNTRSIHPSIKSPSRKNVSRAESVANSSSSSRNNTMTTDDSSVDAKSSLSSKPESEKSGPTDLSGKVVVSAGAASSGGSWGGGRSFAEIVKKQETGVADAK